MALLRRTLKVYVDDAAEPADRSAVVWDATNNRWSLRAAPTTGTTVLVAGTKTVANTAITALSRIFVARQTDGGTVGASYSITRSVGVSFTIQAKDGAGANQALDTSTLAYSITEP